MHSSLMWTPASSVANPDKCGNKDVRWLCVLSVKADVVVLLLGRARLSTMQCWQRPVSTTTLGTTLNLVLHAENTSV